MSANDYTRLVDARGYLRVADDILRRIYATESAREDISHALLKLDRLISERQVKLDPVKWEWTCRICEYVNYAEDQTNPVRCGGCGEEFPVAPG